MAERLQTKINLTQNLTSIVTGHGKTKAYLHRFKIIENPTCPCGKGDQTTDHLIFECELLNKEKDRLKSTVVQTNSWPTNKRDLIRRHLKNFTRFINEIPFDVMKAKNGKITRKTLNTYCVITIKNIVKLVVSPLCHNN